MTHFQQSRIAATYMRGGTSKGVFFLLQDLPKDAQQAGAFRDQLVQRVLGSPDPYGKQIDGMGGASSSTSKVAIVSRSTCPEHDVDYLFGQVSIDTPFVDWSGNCGNLTSAVGAFAIARGLIAPEHMQADGTQTVRIWQANIQKTIVAHVPVRNGSLQETGDFELDGVAFPSAEVLLDFIEPTLEGDGPLFPTGHTIDVIDVPGIGAIETTLINSGIPTVIVSAASCGYTGTETQADINQNPVALQKLESLRAHAALKMGLIPDLQQAVIRQHTPKLVMIAPASNYTTASGRVVQKDELDLLVRAISMGKLHHAMMGTAAVALATAAAIPGTLASRLMHGPASSIRLGHPSGLLRVGAEVCHNAKGWSVTLATLSRSARILMEGWVRVPVVCLGEQT